MSDNLDKYDIEDEPHGLDHRKSEIDSLALLEGLRFLVLRQDGVYAEDDDEQDTTMADLTFRRNRQRSQWERIE